MDVRATLENLEDVNVALENLLKQIERIDNREFLKERVVSLKEEGFDIYELICQNETKENKGIVGTAHKIKKEIDETLGHIHKYLSF